MYDILLWFCLQIMLLYCYNIFLPTTVKCYYRSILLVQYIFFYKFELKKRQ